MIVDKGARAVHLNTLIGRAYQRGAMGPDRFDCYGLARHLQSAFFGRDLPLFQLPSEAGRFAIASAIAVHPERSRWQDAHDPVDGAVAIMSRQECGFHMGVFLELDGGLIVHTVEETGVVADTPWQLAGPISRWRIQYCVPEGAF